MLEGDNRVARIFEQRSHHRVETCDQYQRRRCKSDRGTGSRQHDGRTMVRNSECNARPIRLIGKPSEPGEKSLLRRRANRREGLANKVSRRDRVVSAEWVPFRKEDAPAFPPQLFNGEPICGPRL